MSSPLAPDDLAAYLAGLVDSAEAAQAWDEEDTPAARLMHIFLQHSWQQCRDGLLRKTTVLRVAAEPRPAPRMFWFEVDCPYKRKLGPSAAVECMPGPVRGMICYRGDMFASPDLPYIAVQIDPTLGFFHPNCSRGRGSLLCLGEIPAEAFPFPLEMFLESHLYPIVTYQNSHPAFAFDLEAADYFALDPAAMSGLKPVKSLY